MDVDVEHAFNKAVTTAADSMDTPVGCTSVTITVTDLAVPRRMLKRKPQSWKIKQMARRDNAQLVDEGGYSESPCYIIEEGHANGFIAAVTSAFKDHYPLRLRPQHIWLLILQGIATHVDVHHEQLQERWVKHQGKKKLTVNCHEFVFNEPNNWASVVEGKPDSFSSQIEENLAEGITPFLLPRFSSTSPAENISMRVTVMEICRNFFEYDCMTLCGFPRITLDGTLADWKSLKDNAETLINERCRSDFSEHWLPALLPLLEKFAQEYERCMLGQLGDSQFWNSMCKMGGTFGSGSMTWFNGWFNILFPYIHGSINNYCKPYDPSAGYVKEGRVYSQRYSHGTVPAGVRGPDCEVYSLFV